MAESDFLEDLFDIGADNLLKEKFDRTEIIRAPFAWVGGKSKSIEKIMPHLPYMKKWVDHFVGAGNITFARKPSTLEVINDRYGAVVAFFRCLRDPEKRLALINYLDLMPHSREEFYHCRDQWVTETDDVIRAAKWYYMIEASVIHKGISFARATNSLSPFNMHEKIKNFSPVGQRLYKTQIENLDFEQCFMDYDSHDTVHYFDPPYLNTDQSAYNGNTFKPEDMERLLRCVRNAKGFCALSHYEHPMLENMRWSKVQKWNAYVTAEPNTFSKENGKADVAGKNPAFAVECPLYMGATMSHSMVHINNNLICALDIETTGLICGYHEIVQISMIPLDSNLEMSRKYPPFDIRMKPTYPERIDYDAIKIPRVNMSQLVVDGFSQDRGFELFEHWFKKLNLTDS